MTKLGDKVVCVDDTFESWVTVLYTQLPKKGSIYTIRDFQLGVNVKTIEANPDSSLLFKGNQTATLLLEELHNAAMPISKKEMGFGAWRFKPLTSISLEDSAEYFEYKPDSIGKKIKTPSFQPKRKQRELVEA